MITLTTEIICDTCKRVIACGACHPIEPNGSYWAHSAIHDAVEKAKFRGAHIGISTVTCKECLEKSRSETMTCGCLKSNRTLCPHGNSDLA